MDYPPQFQRYDRQMRYPPIGVAGQQRLAQAHVLLCGCGALGSVMAGLLVRAGVGRLRLVDRDFLETSNLQRQVLFDEQDVAYGLPKAVAAAAKLRQANSRVEIEPVVADLDYRNIRSLADGVDLILDGTDNFETRYLINDLAIQQSIPWIFSGVVGAEGQIMVILPGETACLRCLLPDAPPVGASATCDTAGILGPAVSVIASLAALEALKIASGNRQAANRSLTVCELWDNRIRQIDLSSLRNTVDCRACRRRQFDWLEGSRGMQTAVLCGRNAVQLQPGDGAGLDLEQLANRWAGLGAVTRNPYLARLKVEQHQLTVFADGRAIIGGTEDPAEARSVYARYVGS